MDIKWKYDLADLLRTHKPHHVTITCKGNDNGFLLYQHAITTYFSQNPVIWKRQGKPFPYSITFPVKFAGFDENLCFGPHVAQFDLVNLSYLHLFFIDSASVDEYRTSVRHNVSEWFSKVSTRSDVQWIIIVDSTRAKEKKNRTSLMEKLKNDFSKHTARLVEVSESVEHGSFNGLIQAVQSALLCHLDIIISIWERYLENLRDRYREPTWDLLSYCYSAMEYARLFWSLGAFEHALTIYDDLDRFLFDIFGEILEYEESNPELCWVSSLRSTDLTVCPLLYQSFQQQVLDIKNNSSLIGLRHFLFSQQILLSLYIYHSRYRSRGAAPSLRVDFATLILNYAQHALKTIVEQMRSLKVVSSPLRLECWKVLMVGEVLHVSGLLADPTTLDSASNSLCMLQQERFNAILQLSESWEIGTRETLLEWLFRSGTTDAESLCTMLQNFSVYDFQLQKAHECASDTLSQWGRSRQAAFMGWLLAKWMRRNKRDDLALPLEIRFVSSFIVNGFHSQALVDIVKHVLVHLDARDDRLLEYLLFVALNDSDISTRLAYSEQWISRIKSMQCLTEGLNLKSCLMVQKKMFKAVIIGYIPILQVPNGYMSVDVRLDSSLLVDIDSFSLTVVMREVDEYTIMRGEDPVFELNYNARDQVCRMLALYRGLGFEEKLPVKMGNLVELQCNQGVLSPGTNNLTASTIMQLRGCFVLDSIRISIFGGVFTVDINDVTSKNSVVIFVQSTPNKLWIEQSKDLLAGVIQHVDVTVEAGFAMEESVVNVSSDTQGHDAGIEFMSDANLWYSTLSVPIPSLGIGVRHTFSVPLYLKMDSNLTASPAIKKTKVFFNWSGHIWTFDLPFVALLIITSRTSLLENKALFELEIARASGLAEEWIIVFKSTELEVFNTFSNSPYRLSKMMDPEIKELVPNIVTSLVWILPSESEVPIRHRLSIIYRVKKNQLEKSSNVSGFVDRVYSYEEIIDLEVPKVGYELCTQMLSQQPGAQLCRAGSACDLVISLRSLKHSVEMLYVVLDADEKLWTLNERAKVLQVKESGLGQMVFSVVPCAAGFLPYPSVSVYSCQSNGSKNSDGVWSEGTDVLPGNLLVSFQRTAGKQIRVLGASHVGSSLVEKKRGLKQKIVKLFD